MTLVSRWGLDGTNISAVRASGTHTSIATFAVVGPPATIGFGFALNVPVVIIPYSLTRACENGKTFPKWRV
jgi:hypothetical protein